MSPRASGCASRAGAKPARAAARQATSTCASGWPGTPISRCEDHNLIYEAQVAPWEAVLGANISAPTLGGHVSIKVPPGTQNAEKLRVRGPGLPQRGGSGDLIVDTRIAVPQKVSESERKLWEQLARESRFNPRAVILKEGLAHQTPEGRGVGQGMDYEMLSPAGWTPSALGACLCPPWRV